MKIAVIGTGYVGLVSGPCLAKLGHEVVCVDNDPAKVGRIQRGDLPIFEPGLEELVEQGIAAGRLSFTTETSHAVGAADVVIIAVGTPASEIDGSADLRFVHAAAREIGKSLNGFTVVATKSTVPVGTGEQVHAILAETAPEGSFSVVSNPEFLREGAAIDDFLSPDRIVVGAEDERGMSAMRELYAPLVAKGHALVEMGRRGAELTKYASNALLAAKIGFINEIADLCEQAGANIREVSRGVGLDSRIGPKFLEAGPGYGGSCFPKDTQALLQTGEQFGADLAIVRSVVESNLRRKTMIARRVVDAVTPAARKTVAVLGLAFKANTDDVRESPAIPIVQALLDAGTTVRICDPEAIESVEELFGPLAAFTDPAKAIDGADAIVVVTEWPQFRELEPEQMRAAMRGKLVIDLRNLFDTAALEAAGLDHIAIGAPARVEVGSARREEPAAAAPSNLFRFGQVRDSAGANLGLIDEPSKRILITGGAGFLGSHLAERLAAEGHFIYCLDNLHTGRRSNIASLVSEGKACLVRHDLVDPIPELEPFDEIYNLACPASPVHYQEDPIATLRVCSDGVQNVLSRAHRDGARVFHTSTSEVYGDPEVHPQGEAYHGNVNPVGPRSCYDEGKRFAETFLTDYSARHGLDLRLVRIFNTYGPRMLPNDGRVVSNFIVQALRNEPLTIYGDGSQTRSFCYVDDLIDGFLALMKAGDEAAGPMNIGNPAEITVGELARTIIDMTGSRSVVNHLPLPVDDPRRRRPDISRAQAVLGWEPRVRLADGLAATIAYFDGELSGDRGLRRLEMARS